MADWTQLAQQLRAQGGNWDLNGQDQADALARMLWGQGVRDLSQMRLTDRAYEQAGHFDDARNGAPSQAQGKTLDFGGGLTLGALGDRGAGDDFGAMGVLRPQSRDADFDASGNFLGQQTGYELGWNSEGDGAVGYEVVSGPDGRAQIVPKWNSSNDKNDIMGMLGVFGGAALGAYMNGGWGAGAEAAAGGAAPAIGNGAFVGEGAASGIPAWDAAAAGGGGGALGTSGVNAMRSGEIANYATNGSMPSSAATAAGGGGMWETAGNWLGNNWQNLAGAVLGAASSRDQTQSANRDPWGPAQPFLRELIGQGQQLNQQYQAQPFNPTQQRFLNQRVGLLDALNTQVMPGLLGGLNAQSQGYQRAGGPPARQQAFNLNPAGLLGAMNGQNIDWSTATPYRRG